MSKRKSKQGSHGIYELTCISDKCSRRFKVIYDVRTISVEQRGAWSKKEQAFLLGPTIKYVQLTYSFTGCPFCGAWWCTGPLDGEAYPKKVRSGPPTWFGCTPRNWNAQANIAGTAMGGLAVPWWQTKWTW